MKQPTYYTYEITYITGKAGMLRLMDGLLTCNGRLLDSYYWPNIRQRTYMVCIALPADAVAQFTELTGFTLQGRTAMIAKQIETSHPPL